MNGSKRKTYKSNTSEKLRIIRSKKIRELMQKVIFFHDSDDRIITKCICTNDSCMNRHSDVELVQGEAISNDCGFVK